MLKSLVFPSCASTSVIDSLHYPESLEKGHDLVERVTDENNSMRVSPSESVGMLPPNKTRTKCWSTRDTVAAVNGVFVSPLQWKFMMLNVRTKQ